MAAGGPFWAGYSKETKGRVRPGVRDGSVMAAGGPFWAGYSKETKGRVRPGVRDGGARLRRRRRHRTSRSESQAGRRRRHWVHSPLALLLPLSQILVISLFSPALSLRPARASPPPSTCCGRQARKHDRGRRRDQHSLSFSLAHSLRPVCNRHARLRRPQLAVDVKPARVIAGGVRVV
jgi:hypothetical protein